jgi:hypothetical protein
VIVKPQYTKLRALPIFFAPALFILLCLGHWLVQVDDAYIFYTYVSNLLGGDGFVFNAGDALMEPPRYFTHLLLPL